LVSATSPNFDVTDVDLLGKDLAALALDEVDRFGEVLGRGSGVPVVRGHRTACVDGDHVGTRPRQSHAMRAALSPCGSRDVGDPSGQWLVSVLVGAHAELLLNG
jgi:hypothetical protein